MNKSTLLWTALIFTVLLGFIWQFFPLKDAKERLDSLPEKGLTFSSKTVPLSPFEKEFFQKMNLVKRLYQAGNKQYFITIVDGTLNRHMVHDPTYCFTGDGYTIVSRNIHKTDEGSFEKLVLEKNGTTREAFIWFSNGKGQFTSLLRYWWETTLRRLTLGLSGDEPVLVMVQPVDPPEASFEEIQKNFSSLFGV